MSKKPSQVKGRIWSFIIYPESAPVDWRDQLRATGAPGFISPLHDKDIVEGSNDEEKKSHWHGNLVFGGPTSLSVVSEIAKKLNSPSPKKMLSVKGLYDYCTHKNNPEKHQYDPSDIEVFNGFDISKYIDNKTTGEKLVLKRKINKIIVDEDIYEYCVLIQYLEEVDDPDLLDVAMSNTYHFKALLDSMRYKGWIVNKRESLYEHESLDDIIKNKIEEALKQHGL